MKFLQATITPISFFLCTILMTQPPASTDQCFLNADGIKTLNQQFKENIIKIFKDSILNDITLPDNISLPECFKEFTDFCDNLQKLNNEYAIILKDFAKSIFLSFIDQSESFDKLCDVKNAYFFRFIALYIISERTYELVNLCLKENEPLEKIVYESGKAIALLFFSEEPLMKDVHLQLENKLNQKDFKEQLDNIKLKYFSNVSNESISIGTMKNKRFNNLKTTDDHQKKAVEILNSLDDRMVDSFKKEYDNNTKCKKVLFKLLQGYMGLQNENLNRKNVMLEKLLDLCEFELRIFLYIQRKINDGPISLDIFKIDIGLKIMQAYEKSRKEFLKYLDKPENRDLLLIKVAYEMLEAICIKWVLNINSSQKEVVKNMLLNIIEGQVIRLRNEKSYYANLLMANQ